MNIEQARFNMIEQQIRPWNVLDAPVLRLLESMRREDFVPAAYCDLAFADIEVPLGDGQSMLYPKLEARLLHDLKVQPHERVLEIGTGSGFMAALFAQCAAQVVSIEIKPSLVAMAKTNLQKAGFPNVDVRLGDGNKLADDLGTFDVILLSGSVASVPRALLERLNPKGRLAAIVGDEPTMQAHFVTHTGNKQFTTQKPWDMCAPRLVNFAETLAFSF